MKAKTSYIQWLKDFASEFANQYRGKTSYSSKYGNSRKTDTGGYSISLDIVIIEFWLDRYITLKTSNARLLWIGISFTGKEFKEIIERRIPRLPKIGDDDVKKDSGVNYLVPNTAKKFKSGKTVFEYYERQQRGYVGKYFYKHENPHCKNSAVEINVLVKKSCKYIDGLMTKLLNDKEFQLLCNLKL